MTNNPGIECTVVFCCGLCSYVTSELLEISGVISILVTGIILAHFNHYNLSLMG